MALTNAQIEELKAKNCSLKNWSHSTACQNQLVKAIILVRSPTTFVWTAPARAGKWM